MCRSGGSGGEKANLNRTEQAQIQRQKWIEQNRAQAQPLWAKYLSLLGGGSGVGGGGWFGQAGGGGSTGSLTPWVNKTMGNLNTGNYQTFTPYEPSQNLLGQVNPTLNPSMEGGKLYNAMLSTSNQTLGDQYKGVLDSLNASNVRSGMGRTSFAPQGMTSLAIQRGQGEARNVAGALQARQGLEQSLRGEQRAGAMSVADMLRQASLDKRQQIQDAYQRGDIDLGQMFAYMQMLAQAGDPNAAIGQMGDVASGYSNLAGSYGNMAQRNAAVYQNLLNPASYIGFGGAGKAAQPQPQYGKAQYLPYGGIGG